MAQAGKVVGGRWTLTKRLGAGSFGEIYIAKDSQDKEVAVKLEIKETKHPQLVYEAKLLKALQGAAGIAEVYHYDVEADFTIMVMELMGPSLEDVFNLCKRSLTMKSCVMLADQMLRRIEFMHIKSYIHRDIKPDNFLIGRGQKSNIVYVIDFGLAKKYRNATTLEHGPYRENKNLTGTARYASINAHLGLEQSRRDDLEAIGYVLIYFLKGVLPWQGIKTNAKQDKYAAIMEKKISTPVPELCEGLPQELCTYLEYTRNLGFDEQPDYRYLRWLFQNLFRKENLENDGCFDWTVVKGRPKWQVNELREERRRKEAAGVGLSTIEERSARSLQPTDRANSADVLLSLQSDP